MIRVQKGSFIMGNNFSEDMNLDISDSSFPHEVDITHDYYIGEVPVSQSLWYFIMGNQPSRFNLGGKYPVDSVSWDDCMIFIRELNNALGVEFRLPTEAEWEYAARGGIFSNNYAYSDSNELDEVAWYSGNSDGMTHEIACEKSNELGIYDMSGNVWEWTETLAHSYSDASDDLSGNMYVRRGSSWWHEPINCRVSKRYASDKDKKTSGLGLRVVIRLSN